MSPIEYNNKKLRIAQDLNKKVLEMIGVKLLKKTEDGVYVIPDANSVSAYLNGLAEKRRIKHYRLQGDDEEIYLFDEKEVCSDLTIAFVDSIKTPEVIRIQCYDQPVSNNDEVPIEISRIDELFTLPKSLFNSGSCIYFLCKNNKVVYVGQAENVHGRLVEHMRNKEFDSVFYLKVSAHRMTKIESALIAYLKPEYNRSALIGNNNTRALAESVLKVNG